MEKTWDERVENAAAQTSAIERYLTLQSMQRLIFCMNDTRALIAWQTVMPEAAEDGDLEVIAAEPEQFKKAVLLFFDCMRDCLGGGMLIGGEIYAGGVTADERYKVHAEGDQHGHGNEREQD